MGRKKYYLACLGCGSDYRSLEEYDLCPHCGSSGELTVENYGAVASWDEDSNECVDSDDDFDINGLAYDPDMYD